MDGGVASRFRRAAGRARAAGVFALALLLACLEGPAAPKLVGEGRRALFIGNSYLYLADLPGIVQALADSGGVKLAVETVAGPDLALIDHWGGGPARNEVIKPGWEWVILQQGPSSVEVNRDTLRLATKLFADLMKSTGTAKPALFSAWPQASRLVDFPRAIESYQLAAQDVGGIMLPIASAWLGAWSRNPNVQLYADGLHPSLEGAYLSSLVIYGRLLGRTTSGLPRGFTLKTGASFQIDSALAAMLQAAADSALATVP